ncbi:MAG: Rieske 2Fe-2S domain-containing protein [Sulfolobus sp.]|nr:Rieske 2Fe-2S domain-containing protein [Sulfolobus sp.]
MRRYRIGEKFLINDNIIVVYLGGEKYVAFERYCPHLRCDLFKYGVIIGDEVICQCHFTHFSLKSGNAIKGATSKSLKIYSVKVNEKGVELIN